MSSLRPKFHSRRTRSSTTTTSTSTSRSSTSTSSSNSTLTPLSITPITLSSRRASAATESLAESLHSITTIYSHRSGSGSARRRRRKLKKQEYEQKQQETRPTPTPTMLDRMRSFFSRSAQSQLARQRRATAAIAATIECKQSIPGNACVACGDPLESGETSLDHISYYACPGDTSGQHQHSQCVSCFGAYVRSCCDSYAENSFPLKCPIPSCRHLISDQMMRDLLSHECNIGIMEMYTKACIRSGILDAAMNHDVTPVTCARCEKYTVLLPSNYKARAARFRLHQLREAESARKLEEQRAKEAKLAAQRQAAASVSAHRDAMFQEMFEVIRQRRQRIAHDNVVQTQHPFARLSISLRNVETGDSEAFNRIRAESKQQNESKSSVADDDTLPPTSAPLVRQESDGMLTSLFCICETAACNAATCLRCDATVDADDTEHHICSLDRIQELYVELLDVLAQASVRRCPACNTAGRKDLSCCHMTCACGAVWCYVCGARNTTLPGGNFSKHNENWNIGSATTMCPMYLKYKFSGGTLSNGRYDGDPNRALARFHTSLQRKAVAEYESKLSSVDRALFNDMISLKFPRGIWDADEIRLLDELEAKEVAQRPIEAARLAAAEAARVAAAEQARIQAEQARIAAEERARREAEERARREEERARLEAEERARAEEATRELRERLYRAANLPPGPVPDAPYMEGIYRPPSPPPRSAPAPDQQALQAERDLFQVYVVRPDGPQEVLPQAPAIEAFFQPPPQRAQAPAAVDPFAHIPQLSPQQQQALALPQPVPNLRRPGNGPRPLSSLRNAYPPQAQPITALFQPAPQQAPQQGQPLLQQALQAPQAPLPIPLPVIPAPTPVPTSASAVSEHDAESARVQLQAVRLRLRAARARVDEQAHVRGEAEEVNRAQRQRVSIQRLHESRMQLMNQVQEMNRPNDAIFEMLR